MLKAFLPKLKKAAITSLGLFFIVAVPAAVASSIVYKQITVRYTFDANFIVAVIIIVGGIVLELLPVRIPKKNKLIDHTTHVEYVLAKRAENREKAIYLIYFGMLHLLITGMIQLILSFIF